VLRPALLVAEVCNKAKLEAKQSRQAYMRREGFGGTSLLFGGRSFLATDLQIAFCMIGAFS